MPVKIVKKPKAIRITKTLIDTILKNPTEYANNVSVNELAKVLRFLSDKYYNSGESDVSDEIFDLMKDILLKRDPKNPFLNEVGAPIEASDKVELPYPMGSLDKIKPDTNILEKWLKTYKGPYDLSDKLDGVSAQLYKLADGTFKMYSRGDSTHGRNISHLIKYVISDSVKLSDIPCGTSVRGELIISKKNFKKIENKFKNARNTVAGIVNSKTVDTGIASLIDFVTYSVLNPRLHQHEQKILLKKYNFNVVNYKVVKILTHDLLNKTLIDRRKNSEYDVDGIVVFDGSSIHDFEKINPEYAFAYKMVLDDQKAESTVLEVIWQPSMDGYLKPKIRISPIDLVGVTIENATAFNAKYVVDNKLGPGAVVLIVRSGDVIPHILKVVKPAKEPQMPGVSYEWNKSGVDIVLKDIFHAQNSVVNVKKMAFFFKSLDIKNIDTGVLTKISNAGYNTLEKILNALVNKQDKLAEIEGIGDKIILKIYNNVIDSLKKATLSEFMAASHIFGRGLGEKKIKLIIEKYPDILTQKWDKETFVNNINSIDGFSDITTNKFISNLVKFKKFFNDINKIIDINHLTKIKINKQTGTIFKDEIVVFTGFRNDEMEQLIISNGGKVSGSVSSKTTLVVYSADNASGSKIVKAKELGIKTLSNTEFEKKYMKLV
jgi:DNA ligase (NAD+)